MRKTFWIGVLVLAGMAAQAATNDLTTTLQKGLFEEEANRNLEAAIQAYQSVANQFDKDRKLAATAIFRLGECYRKQGNTNQAVKQFERVVREFSDQSALATLSRQNLAGLGAETTAPASSPARTEQKRLLEEEIQLVQKQLDAQQAQVKAGVIPPGEMVPTQRDLLRLKRQLAALESGQTLDGLESAKSKEAELTSSEAEEVKRIQALIKDSPDLINAAEAGTGNTPLHRAAEAGQLMVAQFLLNNGADTEAKSQSGRTPLHRAAAAGHKAMVELLLSKHANVKATDKDGLTPLHLAAENGYRSVAESLLAHGAAVDATDKNNSTPLLLAAAHGFKSVIELLLAHGANLNAATDFIHRSQGSNLYGTALILAAQRQDQALAEFLLAKGAAVNALNKEGRTALSYAAENQDLPMVKLLLTAHADPNAGTQYLPLASAAARGDTNTLQHLLAAGADPTTNSWVSWDINTGHSRYPNGGTFSPLFLAINQHHPEAVRALLRAKANPNSLDPQGNPVLFGALTDAPTLQALLKGGADPNPRDQDGSTPLQVVTGYNNPSLADSVKALLAHGAEPNVATANGWTPLHQATGNNATNIMVLLLEKGADPNAKTVPDGYTPLRVAVAEGHAQALKILLDHKADPNVRDNHGQTVLDYAKSRGPSSYGIPSVPFTSSPLPRTIPRPQRIPSSPTASIAEPSSPVSLADLLRQHGALENLPRLDAIQLRRPATHFARTEFARGTNAANQFTLAELLGKEYVLLADTWTDPQRSSYEQLAREHFDRSLPYPDLAHVRLRQPTPDLKSWQERTVDLTPLLENGVCTNDVVLSWGEVVEIPELDHPLNQTWSGFTTKQLENLTKCWTRQVDIVVKGKTTKVTLGLRSAPGFWPEQVQPANLWLKPALLNSHLVLASSDLAHVKLIRRDPIRGTKSKWVIDCTKEPQWDFWLQDGDVIEVPEKAPGYGAVEPPGNR
jgi:ankyrin repeat protein